MPAAVATVLASASLLLVWVPSHDPTQQMQRFGQALTQTLARTSTAALLHNDRIALAVIANDIAQYREVAGVAFYDQGHDILAMSGDSDLPDHFTAPATLDDTITGYVSLALEPAEFAAPLPVWRWVASLLTLLLAPLLALLLVQLSQRGNRSLPIVSVPHQPASASQQSFALVVNLYNQLGLGKQAAALAVQDALQMSQEVCALHPGLALPLDNRGVLLLFDREAVNGEQAICSAFLLQRLLAEYETAGVFRCYLHMTTCPASPADLTHLDLTSLPDDFNINALLTLAALSRADTLLLSHAAHAALNGDEREWTEAFEHPLLEDLDPDGQSHVVKQLPDHHDEQIRQQQTFILGFAADA